MQEKSLNIRQIEAAELDIVLGWAAAEGWNPGLHDAACFHAADAGGFLIGELRGEAVAGISCVRYGGNFGFIGLYLVKPAYRGLGHGLALWQAAMARLDGCNIGLDGVVAQQGNYARSGFRAAYRHVRHEGRGSGEALAAEEIVRLSAQDLAAVSRYDRACFGGERQRFLQAWLSQPQHKAVGSFGPQGLRGYAVLRPCRNGYKIAPLFADTPELAEQLFLALQGQVAPDMPIFIDVPEANPAAVALAARHRLQPVFEAARMYAGAEPPLELALQYGIASMELG